MSNNISLRLVESNGPKTGCMACPLLAMHERFAEEIAPLGTYERNAEAIVGKLKEPHTVTCSNLSEEWSEVDVLFVGDGPDKWAETKQAPFAAGPPSVMLRRAVEALAKLHIETMHAAGIDTVSTLRVGYSYVVRCRTPLNRDSSQTERIACSPELERELEQRKPKVVVPLGNFALEFFTGRRGIMMASGRLMRCERKGFENIQVVPCISPGYILHNDHEKGKFDTAIQEAFKVATNTHEEKAKEGEYYVLDGTPEYVADVAVQLLQAFRTDRLLTSFDTETGHNTAFGKKFPRILSFHFSNQTGYGYTIPWDHKDSPLALNVPPPTLDDMPEHVVPDRPRKGTKKYAEWEEANNAGRKKMLAEAILRWSGRVEGAKHVRPKVEQALREFFADPEVPKIAQNEKFDAQQIREELGVWVADVQSDTMLKHMLIQDVRGTHGLENLSHVYTGMGGYHYGLDQYIKNHRECDPDKGGSYANIPGFATDECPGLFLYGAQDADATLRVNDGLNEEDEYKQNPRFHVLAEHYFPILSRTLAVMEHNGASIDLKVIDEMKADLEGQVERYEAEIKTLPPVRAFIADKMAAGKTGKRKSEPFDFNPGSPAHIRQILFDYYGERPTMLTDKGFELLAARYTRLAASNEDLSFEDVQQAAIDNKEWDFFSVDSDVLHGYERTGVDFAPLILKYRKAEKLLGTYVMPMYERLDELGRVHGSFLIHGTVTGRLSSNNPNLQNIPAYAKRAFVSRFGDEGVILSADYSQIELRVAACLFKEPKMMKAYQTGADLHTLTAIAISGKSADDYQKLPKEEQKKWRVRAKRINFGIIYGVGPPGIVNTLRKDGVFIDIEEATQLRDKFRAAYPAMIRNMEKLSDQVRQCGWLESFSGRRRRLPEVFNSSNDVVSRALRQSINFPVQGGAGEITLIALCLLQMRIDELGLRSKLILTVHDQIAVDCPMDEALLVAKEMKYIMTNVHKLSEAVLPGLDWSWLQVPLVAEFDVGMSWGTSVEFDPDEVDGDGKDEPLHWQEDGKLKYRKPYSVDELAELIQVRAAA